jgi:hypothetical protein
MRTKFIKKDLGGAGEVWVAGFELWQHGMEPYIVREYEVSFRARNDSEAKAKIVEFAQKVLGRTKKKNRGIGVLAWPEDQKTRQLIGDRLIRIKYRFRNRNILRVKNPDVALVQGYGSKFHDQLSK